MYTLRDYQSRVVSELKHLPACALYLGTGTGKTITSLELTKYHPTNNTLVVCPHNAIQQWKNTIKEHFPDINIVDFKKSWTSKKIDDYLKDFEYKHQKNAIVINYDMVHRIPELLTIVNDGWTIILDEMHRIKNYGTRKNPVKTTSFMLDLSLRTPWKIGLTATPTQGAYGGYIDYYTQIFFLGYTDMSYDEYYDRYVVYQKKSVGGVPFPIKVIVGYKDIDEVEDILKEVSKSYIPKIGDFEPQFNKIVLDRAKNYAKTIREKVYKEIVLNNSARTRIAKKTLTSGIISGYNMLHEYYEYVDNSVKIDWLREFLEDTDEVVTILYTYNVELALLEDLMKKLGKRYIKINGKTKDKYAEVNEKEYDVVLGQFQAISEALDGLQYKSHIEVFYSMPESSILYKQAIGRIDRIGQEKVPMYYFLVMEKTIDEAILELIENKVEYSQETLDKLEV